MMKTSQRLERKSCLYILGVQTLANGGEANMIASISGISWMRKSRLRIAQQLPRILLDKKTSKIFQILEDHYHAEPSSSTPKQWCRCNVTNWPVISGRRHSTLLRRQRSQSKTEFSATPRDAPCLLYPYQGLRFRKPTNLPEKPISPPAARHTSILQDQTSEVENSNIILLLPC